MDANEKDSLELKKLALEIAEMERSWWKRPTYILAALPTLLAIVALVVGTLNGFFSAQLTKLENQKHDLEAQVKEFEVKRDALHLENENLTKKNADAMEWAKREIQARQDGLAQAERCEEELAKLKARQK